MPALQPCSERITIDRYEAISDDVRAEKDG
ncbi:hypothetical protein C823_005446 [Eubacterium plexicaudatum ASF492]|uniref:Uncharacterized protein n=1 Tax=Eubacterium plexicaudatum ASF492 TaxID=1235802 RepID=N2AXL9_9FIRM|nr:hypothetical protein C823_005446 [Eubacterium plexicaudatum ASF492]